MPQFDLSPLDAWPEKERIEAKRQLFAAMYYLNYGTETCAQLDYVGLKRNKIVTVVSEDPAFRMDDHFFNTQLQAITWYHNINFDIHLSHRMKPYLYGGTKSG